MKIACISPDDLSTLIFCKTLTRILIHDYGAEISTISSVDRYAAEIASLDVTHIEVPMARWLSPPRDLLYLWRLYRILRRGQYDLVITFTTKPNIYGVIAAHLAGVRHIVMAVRGLGQMFNPSEKWTHNLIHHIVKNLYALSCRLSSKIWFTNKNDLAYFVNQNIVARPKTFLTSNAVDMSEFSMDAVSQNRLDALRKEFGFNPNDLVVIMVARLIWSKGIREFVEAAKLLYADWPNLHFLLVAPSEPGSPESVPEEFVRSAERESNLHWLGFRKDVRDLYALADLSVLPSYYKEGGYPRALLEAMAMGKPVIAANTEDCKSPVEDGRNGYLIPPRDAVFLAKRIADVFEDSQRRAKFGAYSLTKIQKEFDDRIVARQVIEQIKMILPQNCTEVDNSL